MTGDKAFLIRYQNPLSTTGTSSTLWSKVDRDMVHSRSELGEIGRPRRWHAKRNMDIDSPLSSEIEVIRLRVALP